MLYSIDQPNFVLWLSLLREILDNKCIEIVFTQDYDVMDFEINLNFLVNYWERKRDSLKVTMSHRKVNRTDSGIYHAYLSN